MLRPGSHSVLCRRVKERYASIKARRDCYPVRLLCQALDLHPSGYYEWLKKPLRSREQQDQKLLPHIKQCWFESGGHYGYRNIHLDLKEAKVACGRDRVLRLIRQAGIKAQRGYTSPKGYSSGAPDIGCPICCNVNLKLKRLIGDGSVTLPIFIHTKDFYFWL